MRRARALRDLVVIAALLVLAFLAANALEAFEWLFEFSREHENWQLDEVFVLLMLSGVGFAVFSWRRWRESDRENDRRERAEKNLRESEERYRTVIEQSAENILLVDVETKRILEANASFRRVTGYTTGDLQDMTLHDLIVHDTESVDSHAPQAFETGQHFIGERRYRTKGGSLVDIETNVSVVSYGGKDIFCVVSRNITERKRNEEALRRRDAILQAVKFSADLFLKTSSWESDVRLMLEALGEAAKVSRAYVFENYRDGDGRLCARQRYEWTAPEITPEIDNPTLQALPLHEAGFGRWVEILEKDLPLHGHVRDFPESEQHELAAEGIRSIMVAPVFVEGRWWGLMGFDETRVERDWSEPEVNALRSAASTLGAAIQRVRAEEEVHRSEERFRSLIQNTSDIITILEPDGTVRYHSPAVEWVLGYRPEEMGGRNGFGYVHPEDLERLRSTFEARLKKDRRGVQPPVEVRARHADGSWRHIEMIANYLLDDPNIKGIVVTSRDVTERRRAEKDLLRSEERFRSLFENAADAVFVHDLEGDFVDVNARACESLGYSREELLGMSVADVDENTIPGDFHKLWDRMKPGAPATFDGRHRRRDGRTFPVEVRVGLFEQSGERLMVALARDISDRKRNEEALRASETSLAEAQRIGRLGSWEAEPARSGKPRAEHAMRWSDEMFRILGFAPQEFAPTFGTLIESIHPQDRGYVSDAVRECASKGKRSCTFEHRILRPDGDERFVQARLEMVYAENGDLVRNFGTLLDITERRRVEEGMRRSEKRLAEAQRIAQVGNWEFDVRKNEAYWSDEMFRIFGLSPQQFVPDYGTFLKFVHPEDKELVRIAVRRAMYEASRSSFDYRILRPGGEEVRTVHTEYEIVRDAAGKAVRIVGTIHDITERKALERELEYQAFHDALTGLPNRALFTDRLRHALTHSPREGEDVAMLFLDIDNFKVVNDSLGHEVGDRLLVAIAEILRNRLSPEDTVARFGGDEFCILLERVTGIDGAINAAGRILDALQVPQVIGAHEVAATASIGIVLGSPGRSGAEDLMRKADLAMYRAKSKGKARYELFDPTMNFRAVERLRLEAELRRAVREEEFEVHYQPVVDLATSEVTGVEALLRWCHPQQGLMSPGKFIPLAEETGLIVPLGRWVMNEACRRVMEWQESHPDTPPIALSVNLSGRQFQHPGLFEEVSGVLEDTGLEPECLTLEITETIVMEDEQATLAILQGLKDLGVKVAIDDFGTGYSSLAYLKRFPVDTLKVDRSFVTGLGKNPEDDAIARAIVAFAEALNLGIVAEGIETGEQAALLHAMGCELGQGYYFAHPSPLAAAFAAVEEKKVRSPQRER